MKFKLRCAQVEDPHFFTKKVWFQGRLRRLFLKNYGDLSLIPQLHRAKLPLLLSDHSFVLADFSRFYLGCAQVDPHFFTKKVWFQGRLRRFLTNYGDLPVHTPTRAFSFVHFSHEALVLGCAQVDPHFFTKKVWFQWRLRGRFLKNHGDLPVHTPTLDDLFFGRESFHHASNV